MQRVILLLLSLVIMPMIARAQEIEDYMHYKFYDETEEEKEGQLWWLAEDVDSLEFHSQRSAYYRLSSAEYALRSVEFRRRGEEQNEEQYLVEGFNVGYSTQRLLAALGFERGVGRAAFQPSTHGRATVYNVYNSAPGYDSHRLRADMSGRNTLGSVSYRARYQLSRNVTLKQDWQFAHYLRVNTGRDLYIDALSGNGFDIATSAMRCTNNRAMFVAVMLPWSRKSVRQYSVEEAFTLTGNHHYNPAWGLQDGGIRSSRQNSKLRPEVVGAWWRRLGGWTEMTISWRGAVESSGRRALAWFDAPTPMPDNYKYLPSYFLVGDERRLVEDAWVYNDRRYTQIDWDKLYKTNAIQSDGHALYVVENRRSNLLVGDVVANFETKLRGFTLNYGVEVDIDTKREFKVVDDLMGAEYLLDIDYFIRDDDTYSTQYRNNLRDKELEVGKGDKFGYDYRLTRGSVGLFGVARWSYADFDFEAGVTLRSIAISRRGYFEKELFAGSRSYGKSRVAKFYPAALNIRCDYSLDNHRFNALFFARSNAPYEQTIFLQPNYNNRLVEKPQTSLTLSSELGYEFIRSNLKVRASLFLTHHARECDVVHYYDDLAGEYVDAVVSDIASLNFGLEADISVRWSQYLSSQFTLAVGRYRYTKDATVMVYADDDNTLIANTKSYMSGVRRGCPELAAYGDVGYRRAGWRATATVSYWGLRHVSPSYLRRTERMLSYAGSQEGRSELRYQQNLGAAASLGVNVAKSFRFGDGVWMSVQFSVDNLLNSKMIYGGYEQHRVRSISSGNFSSVEPFANKLSYAYGRTFRLSVSLGF